MSERMVQGAIDGLSKKNIQALEALALLETDKDHFVSAELAEQMLTLSEAVRREVGVLIDRAGRVRSVSVGSVDQVMVEAQRAKRSDSGYSGLRLVHTHPSGSAHLSESDRSALVAARHDCIVALALQAGAVTASVAVLEPRDGRLGNTLVESGIVPLSALNDHHFMAFMQEREVQLSRDGLESTGSETERAVLVFLLEARMDADVVQDELLALVETAGLETVGIVTQRIERAHRLGKGKVDTLRTMVQETHADVVIVESELTPSYNKFLEEQCGVKVLDKTALILDIFAQRARSSEGKLQVELAQLNYLLPRLTGQGVALSRLGGGVGTRGPGETKLETDRRHIRRRIHHIRERLRHVTSYRQVQQSARSQQRLSQVALVGYTNAGKSSLMNVLAESSLYVEDQLFATLDPTTRRIDFDDGHHLLISDTVGFIRDMPPQLMEAFKSTFDELRAAGLLLHVIDVAQPGAQERMRIVDDFLKELGVADTPRWYVLNKADLLQDELPLFPGLKRDDAFLVSIFTGAGIDALHNALKGFGRREEVKLALFLPHGASQGKLLALAYRSGTVENMQSDDTGLYFEFYSANSDAIVALTPYVLENDSLA